MKTSRKSGRAKVQANIVCSCIGQRTKARCSYGWVVLKNQRYGRLHAHGNGELPGTGLRRRIRSQQTEQAAHRKQGFHSAEFEVAAHRQLVENVSQSKRSQPEASLPEVHSTVCLGTLVFRD